ncbi:nuclear transport factor 2-like isoform X1 [Phoenix dactylifera]|uniref:Nuclear transport factor 2-like isoform X1 n=1 Tax=Phoenix dactylifera TaxID=42345 RepID=A0A8B7BTJ0_PHODC|nr:nuclear transport factor 2-like isoform X1 [Phoenix dactylifera]
MASSFPGHVTAVQVGSYFVGQYYHILQQQPELVHQFYTNASTMKRFDGTTTESATGMLQIHNLVMCLNFNGIEIKNAHSLESWSGGVLVMVCGYVQLKDYSVRRQFVQTFFLAPQEKGYFVLNDIFHFIEEEHINQHPTTVLASHNNFETKLNASSPIPEPVSNYMMGEEIQATEFDTAVHEEENDIVEKYSIPEPQQQVLESDERIDETSAEEPTVSYPNVMTTMREPPPAPAEEPVGEPPKQTYASILRSKGQSGHSAPYPASLNKTTQVASDRQHAPQSAVQLSQPAVVPEKSSSEALEESATFEYEGESRSVYVGNLPSFITASDLEQEFKNFGRIRPDGVTVRSRKEAGVFYAFVEFEDAVGVQNALKASPIQLNGRLIHVEGRRPNSGAFRGGRRGRGRGGYQTEASRGRFGGRNFSRGSGQDNSDRDYSNRLRGNGYLQRGPRQERGILGNQALGNGSNPFEASS